MKISQTVFKIRNNIQ